MIYRKTFKAMGCLNEIQIQDNSLSEFQVNQLLDEAIQKAIYAEHKYSRYREDSVLSQINQSAGKNPIQVDSETASLLNYAQTCYLQSDGLFDITSGILRTIWNFDQKIIPNQSQIDDILHYIGWNKIQWDGKKLYLPESKMQLDFGGIVKEFTADQISHFLQENHIESHLVNLGGDIKVNHRNDIQNPYCWRIAIKHPRQTEKLLGIFELSRGAVATSGDYERFFIQDNQRYCHLFNSKTGYPIQDGQHLQSVSIVADFCVVAGSLSTFAMLLPQNEALDFLSSLELNYLAIDSNSIIYNK